MKQILLLAFLAAAVLSYGQKEAKGTLTTSASIEATLSTLKDVGKDMKYGSRDMDASKGTLTLWKLFPGGNGHELQILVAAKNEGGKTSVTLRMPHLPNVMGSFAKEIKKFDAKLAGKLPELQIGAVTDEIE